MAWRKNLTSALALLLLLALASVAGAAPPSVNVNTADAATIASTLSGVGMKKAEAIVAYREANGRFDAPADLTRVKGIGPSIVERNADKIVVSEAGGGNAPASQPSNAASSGG